jgi:hypothetical protein
MPLYRVQVAAERGNDLTIDDSVNTFYLQDIGPTSDPQNLAQDAATLWTTFRNYPTGHTRITAKIYDMEQAEPRVPLATAYATPTDAGQAGAPREVALCLSFYASVNQPRRRGRLYIGPWHQNAGGTERPAAAIMNQLQTLAQGLANLGGVDVDWMQYSPTTGVANKVTNWWVDNEWDTVRSRGLKGTSRISGTTDE